MGTNLRIGVAGLGAASKQILPHIDRVPGMALTAGADTRPDAVEEFQKKYQSRKAFNSVEEMYASGEIDAVWIATPNVNHADHTVAAAEHGIHVIVEKPTAVTLAETDRMIEACDRNKVKLVQGHSKVYGPEIQKIREDHPGPGQVHAIDIHGRNRNRSREDGVGADPADRQLREASVLGECDARRTARDGLDGVIFQPIQIRSPQDRHGQRPGPPFLSPIHI